MSTLNAKDAAEWLEAEKERAQKHEWFGAIRVAFTDVNNLVKLLREMDAEIDRLRAENEALAEWRAVIHEVLRGFGSTNPPDNPMRAVALLERAAGDAAARRSAEYHHATLLHETMKRQAAERKLKRLREVYDALDDMANRESYSIDPAIAFEEALSHIRTAVAGFSAALADTGPAASEGSNENENDLYAAFLAGRTTHGAMTDDFHNWLKERAASEPTLQDQIARLPKAKPGPHVWLAAGHDDGASIKRKPDAWLRREDAEKFRGHDGENYGSALLFGWKGDEGAVAVFFEWPTAASAGGDDE